MVNIRQNLIVFNSYQYLLKQLVMRDFKVRYKRSVFGMLWSMLNPLLTSLVLSFVFSNIFETQVEHYIVYVMSGLVVFNYYSEASNLAMASIVDNKSLITKVYIPKYIFPLSKILSSGINFFTSFLALFIVCLISGVPLNVNYLFMPILFANLLMFTFGMGCLLATAMVFFDDMKFLYSVLLMLWVYATPIMYPVEILGLNQTIMNLNPIYPYIVFMRNIVLYNKMPTVMEITICFLYASIACVVGLGLFKRFQNKFILHI